MTPEIPAMGMLEKKRQKLNPDRRERLLQQQRNPLRNRLPRPKRLKRKKILDVAL
jgi:hypothetical protein